MDTTAAFTFFEQFFGSLGIVLVWLVCVLYGTFIGSARLRQAALSLPLALFLFGIIPASILAIVQTLVSVSWVPLALFVPLFGFSLFVIGRANESWRNTTGFLTALLTATSLVFLVMLTSYTLLSPQTLAPYYPDMLEKLFTNTQNTFWIVIVSLVLLFVI